MLSALRWSEEPDGAYRNGFSVRTVLMFRNPDGHVYAETLGRDHDFAELVDPDDGAILHDGPFVMEAVRPRNDGLTYDRMWKTALRANPDLVTVTSYNEWQEGTQIEPARVATGKPSYEGAWGMHGVAAQRSYLAATAHWAERLRGPATSR